MIVCCVYQWVYGMVHVCMYMYLWFSNSSHTKEIIDMKLALDFLEVVSHVFPSLQPTAKYVHTHSG